MQMPLKSLENATALDAAELPGSHAWLSANALERNFTLMAQWLDPLMEVNGAGQNLRRLGVAPLPDETRAVAALVRKSWRWGLPVSHEETFMGDYPISGTPLLDPADPVAAATDLLNKAFEGSSAVALLLSHVTGHHVVSSVLVDACASLDAPIRFFDDRQRACLRCNGDHDAWFSETFSRKRRKEFRRLRTRLGEQGDLQFEACFPQGSALDSWINAFCLLEQSGWKGRSGTAVGSTAAGKKFLRKALHGLAKDGKLICWSLKLDGKPLAMMFGVREAGTCWIVKIARDEDFDKFSTGVLLILDVTKWLFEQDALMFADSCAEPGHPMIDHIWKDRLDVRDVMIGRPMQSKAVFAVLAFLEGFRRSARKRLKALLKRLRG